MLDSFSNTKKIRVFCDFNKILCASAFISFYLENVSVGAVRNYVTRIASHNYSKTHVIITKKTKY